MHKQHAVPDHPCLLDTAPAFCHLVSTPATHALPCHKAAVQLQSHSIKQHKKLLCRKLLCGIHPLVCLQLGRIQTTKEPKLQPMYASEDSQGYGYGVPGPAGGQFGQQWDEQQYPPMQPAYNYGNPDDLPQVPYHHPLVVSPSKLVLATCFQMRFQFSGM